MRNREVKQRQRVGVIKALAAQIADAPAPFWRHVREALAEQSP
jgi:hypothetical protein